MKRYGFLLLSLTWLFNSVSVVLFNSLTVHLLRRSRKPAPSESVQQPKETNRKTKASQARNKGGSSSKPGHFSVPVPLRYCNAFCSRTCGNSNNGISRKYLASSEMSESHLHFAGGRQHSSLRHNTDVNGKKSPGVEFPQKLQAALDRPVENISLPFSQSDSKSTTKFEKEAHSSTLKNQKKRRDRGKMVPSSNMNPQNK